MKSFIDYLTEATTLKIMMIGGPGSGKSTYSKAISKHYGIPHIYAGDILRKSEDPEVKALLSKGELAPLDVTLKLIKAEISKATEQAVDALSAVFDVEYIEVLNANNLTQITTSSSEIIIISAVKLGETRLIDNIVFRRSDV